MADIIPNDLSHMSDEDFNALCPQGHHAPGPEPLSPAALSVWCRFCEVVEEHGPPRLGLAAALRAAADQVVPEQQIPRGHIVDRGGRSFEVFPQSARGPIQRLRLLQEVRSALLAIAAELEGADG